MFDEAGGELLQAKLPNHLKLDKVNFTPGMFNDIEAGSLLIVDDIRLEDLRDAAARAVEDGSFQRCGLVVLMDVEILVSVNKLKQFNLSLRSMWATTTVLIKPWTGGLTRTNEGNFVTSAVPTIGERIMQGARKLRQLLKGQTRLIAMHQSGRIVHNGPNAPVNLSMALIMRSVPISGRLGKHQWPRTRPLANLIDPDQAQAPAAPEQQRRIPEKGDF